MIENINQNAITQHEQISSSFSTTNYWNLIPVEIFEKIILQLDVKDIMTSRQVCRRSAHIIDSSNYIRELKSIEKAKSFFAPEDNSMLFTKAINKNFIEYITKNCSLNNNELTMFKWLIDKCNYSAVQFICAKIMSNTNYTLKKIYSFNENDINKYLLLDELFYIGDFFITADSNKFLCILNNNLFELIANNNKLEIAQQIFKNARYCYLDLVKTYKYYIILKVGKDEGNIIFLKKQNNNYKNITPQELNNENCRFIEKQLDKQGNTIFVILVGNILAYYNMHDNQYTTDINITKHLYYSELEVHNVITSKYNSLMIIYGENTTSNKKEAHIYKYNNKIDTLIEPINLSNCSHELLCSPQGDGIIIKYFDSDNKLMNYSVYKIFDNKLQEIYRTCTTEDSYIESDFYYDGSISKYANNGKNIILDTTFDTMLHISANNKIELFDLGEPKKYIFNKSGYMLLLLKSNMIQIYNFHSGIKETSIILCKDTVFGVKFSPNSQLIATVEIIHYIVDGFRYRDLIRIYKIMSVATNGDITMLPRPKQVAEYYSKGINNFKFHPDGTKLIVKEIRGILILEISKTNTTTNNNNLN